MRTNVAFFFGGQSVEHEISIISTLQVINSLNKNKYNPIPLYISKDGRWYTGDKLMKIENYTDIDSLTKSCFDVLFDFKASDFIIYRHGFFGNKVVAKIDVAFPIIHGTNGEDGVLQGFFELKNIPYVGSDVLGSSIGMDKIVMKNILSANDIPTVPSIWFTERKWYSNKDEFKKIIQNLGYPVIVKPSNLGSSIGISQADNASEIDDKVEYASQFSSRILVEKMIVEPREINCSVMGNVQENIASVCEEPLKSGNFLSYEDKYKDESGNSKGMYSVKRIIPAEISSKLAQKIQKMAQRTFEVLNNEGVARIDFLIDRKTDYIYVNEINSIPGSLSFYLWESSGVQFSDLLDSLIKGAFKRQEERGRYLKSYDKNILALKRDILKSGKALK